MERYDVLPNPGIGSIRVNPNRQVLHQRKVPGAASQLSVEEPLDPLVKLHALRMSASELLNLRVRGLRVFLRPGMPTALIALSERTVNGKQSQALAAFFPERVEARVAWKF